jgi:hypothetical protein
LLRRRTLAHPPLALQPRGATWRTSRCRRGA